MHHIGSEALLHEFRHIDRPQTDVVQYDRQRNDILVGVRIDFQEFAGEGERNWDMHVVLARPHVGFGCAPDIVVAARWF
jgi:hypothetical protein